MLGDIGKQIVINKINAHGRFHFQVIVAGVKLLLVEASPIVKQALANKGMGGQLHFNVKLATSLIPGLDIHDGQLIIPFFLFIKWIENLHFHDGPLRRQLQHRPEQMNQEGSIGIDAKQAFKRIVHLGVDAGSHG